jgi:hypothetical protein
MTLQIFFWDIWLKLPSRGIIVYDNVKKFGKFSYKYLLKTMIPK